MDWCQERQAGADESVGEPERLGGRASPPRGGGAGLTLSPPQLSLFVRHKKHTVETFSEETSAYAAS